MGEVEGRARRRRMERWLESWSGLISPLSNKGKPLHCATLQDQEETCTPLSWPCSSRRNFTYAEMLREENTVGFAKVVQQNGSNLLKSSCQTALLPAFMKR